MTKLLVSVQDADEATTALDAGADVIDVKDPNRGSLGAPSPSAVSAVIARIAGRVPLSVACGELIEWETHRRAPWAPGVRFAKLGLAGCAAKPDWPGLWAAALRQLPAGSSAVAVAYADGPRVNAPSTREVLRHATVLGCRVILVDTCDKSAGGLLDYWSRTELECFLRDARSAGLGSAVAGSLNFDSLARVLDLQPDYVAVRGAVCPANREGRIDGGLVAKLVRQIHGHPCA